MRPSLFAAGLSILLTVPASASSIVGWDENRVGDALAAMTNAGAYCADVLTIQHDAVDLVWDIFELKTGMNPDAEAALDFMTPRLDRFEAEARTDADDYCAGVLEAFGPDGSEIASLVHPR